MLKRFLSYTLLILITIVFVTPVIFMIVASFKPDDQILVQGIGIRAFFPREVTLSNYRSVLGQLDFLHFLWNSVFIVGSIVFVGLIVNSMAGYALSRLKWYGRKAVLAVIIAILVVPYEAVAVPLFFEMTLLGWTNSYQAQIIPFIANPFSIYLFYTFFNSLPKELDEAARMDGASPLKIYIYIIVPLARPAFASVAILTFLLHWGFFLWPLMVTYGPDYQPLPVALGFFSANKPVQGGDIMAFCTLMILPVLIIFLVFQKGFIQGIAMAGTKG
jgi:multiple sugar transport system permease protein